MFAATSKLEKFAKMSKAIDAAEVAKHTTKDSCWVILYGNVYDVWTNSPPTANDMSNKLRRSPRSSPIILVAAT